jgi:hypothetical protein
MALPWLTDSQRETNRVITERNNFFHSQTTMKKNREQKKTGGVITPAKSTKKRGTETETACVMASAKKLKPNPDNTEPSYFSPRVIKSSWNMPDLKSVFPEVPLLDMPPVSPSEVSPSEVSPSEVSLLDVFPSEVSPSEVSLLEVSPSDVFPSDALPSRVQDFAFLVARAVVNLHPDEDSQQPQALPDDGDQALFWPHLNHMLVQELEIVHLAP